MRRGSSAHVGTVVSAEVDPRALPGLVAASQDAARSAPEAGDAAPLLADGGEPADWDAPVPGTGPLVFADIADSLSRGSTLRFRVMSQSRAGEDVALHEEGMVGLEVADRC